MNLDRTKLIGRTIIGSKEHEWILAALTSANEQEYAATTEPRRLLCGSATGAQGEQCVHGSVQLFALARIIVIQLVQSQADRPARGFDFSIKPVGLGLGQGSRIQRLPVDLGHSASWGEEE